MSRPAEIPTWATNDTFNSVGDPWDTDPTKVEPSAGRKAEGWEPTQVPPAEFFNWMMNSYGLWITYLSEFLAWNWFDGTTFTGAGNVQGFAHDAGMDSGRGIYASVSANATRERSSDGLAWIAAATPGTSTSLLDIAGDQSGLMVAVGFDAGGRTIETTADGDVYTDRVPNAAGGGGDDFRGVVWDPSNSLWVICGTGEAVETSPNGTAWTARVTPATDDLYAVATDGSSIIVAVGDAGKILTSPDGVTWTVRVSGVANNLRDVVWAADLGLFVAVGNTDVLTSPDGISWSAATHPGTHIGSVQKIATDGRVLFMVGNATTGARDFSIDGGVTWKSIPQSIGGLPQVISEIEFARGQFFVGGTAGRWKYSLRFEA